ncbi:MAG TPA: RNA polymerase sigma factor [Polyangiaceae bacterium]
MPYVTGAQATELPVEVDDSARLSDIVRAEFRYIWRLCRRLGLSEGDADDAAQQVFIIASRRLADLQPGRERAFLYGVAVNVVAKARRALGRRREETHAALDLLEAVAPSAECLLDQKHEVQLLDALLDAMPQDLRTIFVLHHIEEQTAAEIAEVLGIPPGTAASRIRRAREVFTAGLARLEARRRFEEAKR